jgi:hypothetical protein
MNLFQEMVARDCYKSQRNAAKKRGIGWELTFEQWWSIWRKSRRWNQRGRYPDQYCMARLYDTGPYAVGNVKIVTGHSNRKEQLNPMLGRQHSESARKLMSLNSRWRNAE